MCDFVKGLKLCTCPEPLPNLKVASTWTLKRYFNTDWMNLELGRCGLITYATNEKEISNLICLHLNTENCFDFDYKPVEQDTLNLELVLDTNKILKYEFAFENGQWELAESVSDHLNSKLIINHGYIG